MIKKFFPMHLWSKQHLSLLLYIDYEMINMNGFEIGYDIKMQTNEKHMNRFKKDNPFPKRTEMYKEYQNLQNKYPIDEKDDWNAIEDMIMEGIFTITKEEFYKHDCCIENFIGETLFFSKKGEKFINALRNHRMQCGKFNDFIFKENVDKYSNIREILTTYYTKTHIEQALIDMIKKQYFGNTELDYIIDIKDYILRENNGTYVFDVDISIDFSGTYLETDILSSENIISNMKLKKLNTTICFSLKDIQENKKFIMLNTKQKMSF